VTSNSIIRVHADEIRPRKDKGGSIRFPMRSGFDAALAACKARRLIKHIPFLI